MAKRVAPRLLGPSAKWVYVLGRPRRVTAQSLAGVGVMAAVVASVAVGHSAPVRNQTPQQAAYPINDERPIFYPRATGRARPGDAPADRLLREFMDLHTAMKYERAAAVAEQLVQLRPDHPDTHYNVACVLARLHRIGESLAALDRAIDAGWRDITHASLDPDLDSVRGQRRFARLLQKIRRLTAVERIKPSPLRADSWPRIADDIARRTPQLLRRYRVPGAAVALVQDGEVVWSAGFGVRDLETATLINDRTLFSVPAASTLFTAIAAVQQHEQGRLDLAIVPEFHAPTGLTIVSYRSASAEPANDRRRWRVGRLTLVARSETRGPASAIGGWVSRAPAHQSVPWPAGDDLLHGHLAAIAAVEAVSGEPFGAYCRQRIFAPLGLHETWLELPGEAQTRLAIGHSRLSTPVEPARTTDHASGSVYATAGDLAQVLARLMFQPQPQRARLLNNSAVMTLARFGNEFGLRSSFDEAAGAVRMELADVVDGVGVLMRWYPQSRRGVVVLFNGETGPEAALRIAHIALGGA
ncbi:MAG: serine hydrolase [Phycisphaerales bacterium]